MEDRLNIQLILIGDIIDMKTRAESLLESLNSVPTSLSLNEGVFGRPEQREIDRLTSEIRAQLKEAMKKDKEKFLKLVEEQKLLSYERSIHEVLGSDSLIDSFVEKSLRMSSLNHVKDVYDKCCYILSEI